MYRAALNNPTIHTQSSSRAVPYSLPSPIGGLNTRDALDAMEETDAVEMDNFFPTVGDVELRKGFQEHRTVSATHEVDTLVEFNAGGETKLLAAANGQIWDATTASVTSLKSGFTSDQWQTANFNGRIFFVNGADAPQDYDGTSLINTAWTGPTVENLIDVMVFKNRLFFAEKDSQSFWYAAIDTITGSLTQFNLSRVGRFGGKLMVMGTWSLDGGNGIDDYAVFIMSSGEAIIYQGTDPGVAANWSLVGVYRISPPISRRGVIEIGGDVIVITRDDYVSISEVLRNGQVGVASKLSGAVKDLSAEFNTFGWQAILYRQGSMIIYNHPDNGKFRQHAVNALTGAACRFTGQEARCWVVYNDELYFGAADGKIYKADTGNVDGTLPIEGDALQAWNDFGTSRTKNMKAVRAVLKSSGQVGYGLATGYDFSAPLVPTQSAALSSNLALWDVALWDVSFWASEAVITNNWRAVGGTGINAAIRVRISGRQEISWLRTDLRMTVGQHL